MARLETVFLRTLRGLDANQLDEITADGHAFASRQWFELLESLDLNEITQGDVKLAFATVYADGRPELMQPILRARGSSICALYSLRRLYFESWIDGAVRLRPNKQNAFAKIFAGVSNFRRAMEWTGAPLDDCWIVGSPLTYRSRPAVSPSASVSRTSLFARLLADLQRLSRSTQRPLWFLGVEGGGAVDPWRSAIRQAGCAETFLCYDYLVRLESFKKFGEYVRSLPSSGRRAMERDGRRMKEAGLDVRTLDDFQGLERSFAHLHQSTSPRSWRFPSQFWKSLAKSCAGSVESTAAFRGDELVGFSTLLGSRRRAEIWSFCVGSQASESGSPQDCRNELGIDVPIRRATELNYRRLWLGPGGDNAKRLRGAEPIPLHSYFYFPRRFDRWTLRRYLCVWGRIARKQLDRSLEPSLTESLMRPTKAPNRG